MKKPVPATKNQERHELGYLLDAPLPTMLTHEEVYGNYTRKDLDYNALGGLDNTMQSIAGYLNNSLITDANDKRPSMDEATFVRAWLPHFYNGNAGREDVDPSVTLTWINAVSGGRYAGSYHSVDIIRDGQVIYRVPPVYGRLNVIGPEDRRLGVALLYKNMDDTLKRVPHAVNQQERYFLEHIFDPKNDEDNRSEFIANKNLKYIYVLDEIFTYYGYETILTPELMSIKEQVMGKRENGTQPSRELPATIQSSGSEDLEYDEDDSDLFG